MCKIEDLNEIEVKKSLKCLYEHDEQLTKLRWLNEKAELMAKEFEVLLILKAYLFLFFGICSFFQIELKLSDFSILPSNIASFFSDTNFESNSVILSREEIKQLEKLCGFKIRNQKLLYRASSQRYSAKLFHDKCNFVANTLTIIQSENGFVFGGFTKKSWDCNFIMKKTDTHAFIFSFKNEENKPEKLLVNPFNYRNAISCNPINGPVFGDEIIIADKCNEGLK